MKRKMSAHHSVPMTSKKPWEASAKKPAPDAKPKAPKGAGKKAKAKSKLDGVKL